MHEAEMVFGALVGVNFQSVQVLLVMEEDGVVEEIHRDNEVVHFLYIDDLEVYESGMSHQVLGHSYHLIPFVPVEHSMKS